LKDNLDFAHKTRTAEIVARWQKIGYIGEISPKVAKNFEQKARIWFFEINLELLSTMLWTITKAKDLSEFQWSNFDISFVVSKDFEWKKLHQALEKIDPIVEKIELFDIYENEEKLPWQRSLSFKVYLQKSDSEVVDKEKNDIIEKMVQKAEKLWAKLR
jgi:phenylalanyl-tRNA synthetase beta chain